jgi:sugar phosphate isomerase/epimerase
MTSDCGEVRNNTKAEVQPMQADIYIGTILLEPNRWSRERRPSYRVSDWLSRFAAAGFAGMELWEFHATLAAPEEVAAIAAADFPVAIYNTYASFDEAGKAARDTAANLIARFRAKGVKFNLGPEREKCAQYIATAEAWRQQLPAGTKLLCECHSGTVMEDPEVARAAFAAWEKPEFQAIVHPFYTPLPELQRWFTYLGPRITHAHVQLRDEANRMINLHQQPQRVREALRIMREEGFQGTFTLEFTAGTGASGECPETLFQAALADLDFLRECLA